jgi:hypothetical protein
MLFDYCVQQNGEATEHGFSLKGMVRTCLTADGRGEDWVVTVLHNGKKNVITSLRSLRQYVLSVSNIETLPLPLAQKLQQQ